MKKPGNKYASFLLGSERPFGQVHLFGQIFGLEEDGGGTTDDDEEEKESSEEGKESNDNESD